MFDRNIFPNINAYVYMLVNPDNNKPFYIGKGNDNRVYDHINCALKDIDAINAKYDMIKQIQNSGKDVKHIIVRHGLTDKEAFHIEASLIDSFTYSEVLLKNKQGGHNSIEKGLMTDEEIKRIYSPEKLTFLDKNCVIININKKYPKKKLISSNSIAEEIYFATKGIWTMGKSRIFGKNGEVKINVVLSEYQGLIVEVFEVKKWYTEKRGYSNKKAKKYGQMKDGYCFEGEVACDEIRNQYINKSINHIKSKGAATAIRYTLITKRNKKL